VTAALEVESLDLAAEVKSAALRPSGLLSHLFRQPLTLICGTVLLLVVLACVLAPVFAPQGPLDQDLLNAYAKPSTSHLLGTDQLGRDILSRLMYGGRVTLLGIVQAVVVCAAVGLILGVSSGTLGGWFEIVVMRISDVLQSVPGLVILLVVLAIFGQNESAAMITFGLIIAPNLIRVVNTTTATIREEPYVAGARVAGLTSPQIMRRHILPAVAGPTLTQVSIVAALACLVEAGIGFLGLGVPPPTPSWGNMVTDAQQAIAIDPWMLVPAGGMIALVALALTLLGNGIRDAYAGRSSGSTEQLSWRSMSARVRRMEPAAVAEAQERSDVPADLLAVRGLSVSVPRRRGETLIVDNVSFSVKPGEALGIVGESGCGKSMTISGILRVLPPGASLRAESVRFGGTELTALSERQMTEQRGTGIAFISQEPISSLDPAFTVGHQLAEAVRLHRKIRRARARRVAIELMTQVRLPEPESLAEKYPHELSGGMAQRIAIARALAGKPRLLIADEPTTALDVSVQAEILDLLRDLREQTGMALILVTHDWGVVAEACDRAVVMYAGEVVETAAVTDLIADPEHPYSRALLESSPESAGPRELLRVIPGVVPAPGSWPRACRFANRCPLVHESCLAAPVPLRKADNGRAARCVLANDRIEEHV
jgi:peptide/nickel transport system permease protein